MLQAVTIDFHDTLFQCDEWFNLEVRELPTRYVNWLMANQPDTRNWPATEDPEAIYRALRLEAIEGGIEVDSIECVDRVCQAIGLHVDRETIDRGVDELMRATLETAEPRPGAIETVKTLREAGLQLGIISNAIHHEFLEWALDRFEMSEDFDLVLSSAKAGFYKSRVELYQHAISEIDAPAHAILHVGDSYRFDVAGAAAAGMRTAWLNLKDETAGHVIPDVTVQTMVGLGELLLEWASISRDTNRGSIHAV